MPTETDMNIDVQAIPPKSNNVTLSSHTGPTHTLHVNANDDCTLIVMKEVRRIPLQAGTSTHNLRPGEQCWIVVDAQGYLVGQDPPVIP
jgi:hypothetical protein